MGRTDFDVTTDRLQNQGCFQKVYCNTVHLVFTYNIVAPQIIDFTKFVVLQQW